MLWLSYQSLGQGTLEADGPEPSLLEGAGAGAEDPNPSPIKTRPNPASQARPPGDRDSVALCGSLGPCLLTGRGWVCLGHVGVIAWRGGVDRACPVEGRVAHGGDEAGGPGGKDRRCVPGAERRPVWLVAWWKQWPEVWEGAPSEGPLRAAEK